MSILTQDVLFSKDRIPPDLLDCFEPAECCECYVCNTVLWCREVWRVLRDDGVFFLNLGDSYAGSGGGHAEHHKNPGISNSAKRGGVPHYGKLGVPSRYSPKGFKPKDLMLVPHRVAIALQNDGWWVRSDIVWNKVNPMPESVKDRPTKSHEYIFLLTKREKYFYDQDAIREENKRIWNETNIGDKNRINTGIMTGKVLGRDKDPHIGLATTKPNPAGRNKRSVWTMTTKPYKGAHFATFPPELPETCIKAGTSEKGVCPVCGSQWARVTEKETTFEGGSGKAGKTPDEIGGKWGEDRYGENILLGPVNKISTIGWKPTCSCYDFIYRTFPRVKSARKRYQQDAQNEWWKRVRKRSLDFAPCERCKGTGIDPEDEPEMACYDCVGAGWVEVVTVSAVVADIFCGSGTTPMVASQLGRIGIGIDLSWEYLQLARERTGEKAWKEWIEGKKSPDLEETLEELPLFKVQNK